MAYNLTPWWFPGVGSPTSESSTVSNQGGSSYNVGTSTQQSENQSTGRSQQSSSAAGGGQSTGSSWSSTYIPEYSQTPILEGIAKYAQSMAPQVYQWGMDTYNKNQGQIDNMMKDAMSYASPSRVAQEMGMAQSGVMQGAEAGRQNAMKDLQSFGVDPSSGRYAALDTANRTMASAMAAGAGNQQRMATEATGNTMKNQALSASLQNTGLGYQASGAMNDLLGTGMKLQYSPLGTNSGSNQQSTNWNTSESQGTSENQSTGSSSGSSSNVGGSDQWGGTTTTSSSGPLTMERKFSSGFKYAEGGGVPDEISKSGGAKVDDVPANLTAGEFIIPKDIVEWKGQEFFYKLMAATRKLRAAGGNGESNGEPAQLGYGAA
jgi:hypothetical protein